MKLMCRLFKDFMILSIDILANRITIIVPITLTTIIIIHNSNRSNCCTVIAIILTVVMTSVIYLNFKKNIHIILRY